MEYLAQRVEHRIAAPYFLYGLRWIGAAKPHQGGAHEVGPCAEGCELRQLLGAAGEQVGADDGEAGGDVDATVADDALYGIECELPLLGPLHLGVEMGEQRSARHVAGDDQVVAGGEECRAAFDLDDLDCAEWSQPDDWSLYCLAQQIAAELIREVVEGDDCEA